VQWHDVFLWIDDARDLIRQRLERPFLLLVIVVPIISSAHTREHMPQAHLGHVRGDTGAA
jgi:hypothetical protein